MAPRERERVVDEPVYVNRKLTFSAIAAPGLARSQEGSKRVAAVSSRRFPEVLDSGFRRNDDQKKN
jgi:hypothetical protein